MGLDPPGCRRDPIPILLSRWLYYLSSIPTLLLGVKNWPKMVLVFLGLPVSRPFLIELRNGCRFQVRTPMDIWIIKEICLDHQYERASVEFEDGWVVLDIGAGLGDFAVAMANGRPRTTVYAYEPFPASFALLETNLGLNQVQNVTAFPCAVCAEAGPARFHISSEAVAHTTAEPGGGTSHDSIQVPAITLEQVFADLRLSGCDYLKMDCEGAEYAILLNASTATLLRVRHLCLEYHDGVAGFSHHDLVHFLEERGFQVRLTPCPAYRHLGLLYALNPTFTTTA